jgi:hypothetical protein
MLRQVHADEASLPAFNQEQVVPKDALVQQEHLAPPFPYPGFDAQGVVDRGRPVKTRADFGQRKPDPAQFAPDPREFEALRLAEIMRCLVQPTIEVGEVDDIGRVAVAESDPYPG